MSLFTIYHNPKCSKSRKALEILQNHHIYPVIIEYLKTPLNLEALRRVDEVSTNEIETKIKQQLTPTAQSQTQFRT